jgi:excisionase family DNA binding protein
MLPVSSLAALLDEVEAETAGREDGTAAPLADLTAADVARALGRSPSTVRGWLEAGEIPGAFRFNNREWRISRSDFAAFLERKRREKEPERAVGKRPRPARGSAVDLGAWRKLGVG